MAPQTHSSVSVAKKAGAATSIHQEEKKVTEVMPVSLCLRA